MPVCLQRNPPDARSGHTHMDYRDDRHSDDMHRIDVLHNKRVDGNTGVLYDSSLADDNRDHGVEVLATGAEWVDAEPVDVELVGVSVKVVAWAVAVEVDLAAVEGVAAVM